MSGLPTLVLMSGADEFIPSHIKKEDLAEVRFPRS